jgi:hypothetical protein
MQYGQLDFHMENAAEYIGSHPASDKASGLFASLLSYSGSSVMTTLLCKCVVPHVQNWHINILIVS